MSTFDPNRPGGSDGGAEPLDLEDEARRLVAEAKALLESLRSGREAVEAKMQEQGRIDAMRQVRGNSALDLAIDRTESMLEALEEIRHSVGQAPGGA
jgi:hypothetical protein